MLQQISQELLQAALSGLRLQEQHLQQQIAEVESLLNGRPATPTAISETPTGKRRKFSAASRRKMAAAQKARWAKLRGESAEKATPAKSSKPKRHLSAAARKAISEATKKRWASYRAAQSKPVVTRKAA